MLMVAVFCSASQTISARYKEIAVNVGKEIAGRGFGLVYGGGRKGTMGLLAQSAYEAGAPVHGIIAEAHYDEYVAGNSTLQVVADFYLQKLEIIKCADAFLGLPGGFGTLCETFDILNRKQAKDKTVVGKPLVLLDMYGYYKDLRNCCKTIASETFADGQDYEDLIRFARTTEEAFDFITSQVSRSCN